MLRKTEIYKFLIVSILLTPFISYFINVGVVVFAPFLIATFLVLIAEIFYPEPTQYKDWLGIFIWLPYVIWSILIYISTSSVSSLISTTTISILSLPFITLSLIRLRNTLIDINYINFLKNIVIYFSIAQLIICLGQISTLTLGIGLPVTDVYASKMMVSGTFYNSNDLGSNILLLFFIYSMVERTPNFKSNRFIWLILLILLLISGSRSALFIAAIIYILNHGINLKKTFLSFMSLSAFYYLMIFLLGSSSNSVIMRSFQRTESLFSILKEGVDSDSSTSLRLESYLHYFKNIPSLGLGTWEKGNYIKYSEGASFSSSLMFQNPHSLIIEISYWLGLPGLIAFITALLYIFKYSQSKTMVIIVLITSSLIPATVLDMPSYFALILCAIFTRPKQEKNVSPMD